MGEIEELLNQKTDEAQQRNIYLLPSDEFCIDFYTFGKTTVDLACNVVRSTFQLLKNP